MPEELYRESISLLLKAVPDIGAYYEKRSRELYARDNPHVVYGSILVEYVRLLADGLSEHPTHGPILVQVFELIEKLASSSEFEARCLIEASVLEGLLGERGGIERFAGYMGPRTTEFARALAVRWRLSTVRPNKESAQWEPGDNQTS